MRAHIRPGGRLAGEVSVPGDKSIAHRWLILAATARGASHLRDLPFSLDVLATARCLARLAPAARSGLEAWTAKARPAGEESGFTWSGNSAARADSEAVIEGEGREDLAAPGAPLDCANSGTSMRLLAGVAASSPFRTVLVGDESLMTRPMERVARPLRLMGASITTEDGRPPLAVEGGTLEGIEYRTPTPSAQVKGAVLLAGTAARGRTVVAEPAPTRDHTERALAALGGPVERHPGMIAVSAFQHDSFDAAVPGDVSSAAFLLAGAALGGSEIVVRGVGLNPSRLHFLEIASRMGIDVERGVLEERVGEPVGDIRVAPAGGLRGTVVEATEFPLVVDEVPVLALLAAHAAGESRFCGLGELRVKESDRLAALVEGIRGLGGDAKLEGDDLVVAGGGLEGGRADAARDHRIAMALAVGALGAGRESEVDGIEWAEVSFPGFAETMRTLGADIEILP